MSSPPSGILCLPFTPRVVPAILIGVIGRGGFNGPRAVADEAPGRLGLGGPWHHRQEILRRDDVGRTSCPGPNDVLFRRRDDVEPWTPDDVLGTSDDDVCYLRLNDVFGTLVPNYTVWRQRHMCVCKQLAQGCTRQRGGLDSNPRPADCHFCSLTTRPQNQLLS